MFSIKEKREKINVGAVGYIMNIHKLFKDLFKSSWLRLLRYYNR